MRKSVLHICNLENQRKPPTLKLERDDPEAIAGYPGSSGSYELMSRGREAAADMDGTEPEPAAEVVPRCLGRSWSWQTEAAGCQRLELLGGGT